MRLLVWPLLVLVTINATCHLACDPRPSGTDTQTHKLGRPKPFPVIIRWPVTSPGLVLLQRNKNIVVGIGGLPIGQDGEMDAIRCERGLTHWGELLHLPATAPLSCQLISWPPTHHYAVLRRIWFKETSPKNYRITHETTSKVMCTSIVERQI